QRGPYEFNNGKLKELLIPGIDKRFYVSEVREYGDSVYLLATRGYGLMVVRMERGGLRLLFNLNSKTGLGSDFVNRILVDGKTVWLIAMNGVYKITDLLGRRQIDYIGTDEGMPENTWESSMIQMDTSGNVYIAGTGGLMSFRKDVRFRSLLVQRTYLTGLSVGNKPFSWRMPDSSLSFTGLPPSYEFRPRENSLSFSFTGINLYKPGQVKYQYRLKGYSDSLTVTNTPYVTYNDLPPGDYTFEVRSTANFLFGNEPYERFSFTILTPFWMTWWFRTLVLLTIAGIVYAFYRWRLHEQVNKQKLRLSMEKQLNESKILAFQARMNPHFIFNSLNAIQYFMVNNDKVATLNYLSKFAKLLRQILDNTIEAKVNLEKEIDMLRSYIEIEELRFDNKFNYQIEIREDLIPGNMEIPGMIIQPFVENAILHGLLHKKDKGVLRISFDTNGRQVICTIEDNGIGRKASEQMNRQKATNYQSHGTSIAVNRLQLLNDSETDLTNRVFFEDLGDEQVPLGTKVTIQIPII
ncbi:MAG: hypothetical protein EOP49_03570, partial [Sphingobacteriales bacterium]